MKKCLSWTRRGVMKYLAWGWPFLVADAALEQWGGPGAGSAWRSALNSLAFLWVLCAPIAISTLVFDRERRERAMARLCGLREGDERERAVTGEAARSALLLALALQAVLLVMTMVSVRVYRDTRAPKGEKQGVLSVGLAFSSSRHLDPFDTGSEDPKFIRLGAKPYLRKGEIEIAGGFLLAPSAFPVLALLMLTELAAFKAFALRRYEGAA